MMKHNGVFITLEGIEGVGKSTAVDFMRGLFEQWGVAHQITREPGGTPIGEAVREVLLHEAREQMCADTECLLMFAARAQHLASVVCPALEAGEWVLCDRFTDATYAYQGGGRGMAHGRIAVLEEWVQQGLQPDLTIVLDGSVALSHERLAGRAKDRIEQEPDPFFERVRQTYLDRAAKEPERFVVVDAAQPLQAVQQALTAALVQFRERQHV